MKKLKILWKIYFVLILALSIASYIAQGLPRYWEGIDLAMTLLAVAGLAGFCWEKKMVFRGAWRVFLPAFIVWNIIYQYFIPWPEKASDQTVQMTQVCQGMVVHLILIPLVIALFLYAFKSPIWQSRAEESPGQDERP